jgi:hypothetical protein
MLVSYLFLRCFESFPKLDTLLFTLLKLLFEHLNLILSLLEFSNWPFTLLLKSFLEILVLIFDLITQFLVFKLKATKFNSEIINLLWFLGNLVLILFRKDWTGVFTSS